MDFLENKTGAYVFYDKRLEGTSPSYPDMGIVKWRELGLMIPTTVHAPAANEPVSGLYILHWSHFGNTVQVCVDGQLRGSYDDDYHEFNKASPGIYCNPLSSPDMPWDIYKESAVQFATHCRMQKQGDPIWELTYDYSTFSDAHEHEEEPMYKIVYVLAETQQGAAHRLRAPTPHNQDWAWIYPEPKDLHLCYARIIIGLPPQPIKFRYGRYYVDEDFYEGIRQVIPRDKDMGGCSC